MIANYSVGGKLKRLLVLVALVAVAAVAGVSLQRVRIKPQHGIPTAMVRRGQLDLKVYARGYLSPGRGSMLLAPSVGGNLVIVKLAKSGARVHKGDLIVEFDASGQEDTLRQNRYDLLQAAQEITKARADAAVQAAQDVVALLKARYDVRRAELDVSRNPIVSAIDGKKNLLALEEAKRRLAQLEQDIRSHAQSNQASVSVAEEKRRKAQLLMKQAQETIDHMRLYAPFDGMVWVRTNYNASPFHYPGVRLPDYHEGSQVAAGSDVAEVLDVSQMEIQTKVSESDRANLKPGEPVEIRMDALPGGVFVGKVKTVAELASRGEFWASSSMSMFDVSVNLNNEDAQLHPGLSAEAVILGGEVRNALILPRQAVFAKQGKPIVYVKHGGRFEAQPVKITNRTESQVAVEDLREGTEVALTNPEDQEKKRDSSEPAGPSVMGGGK